jgi:hypothetical protein
MPVVCQQEPRELTSNYSLTHSKILGARDSKLGSGEGYVGRRGGSSDSTIAESMTWRVFDGDSGGDAARNLTPSGVRLVRRLRRRPRVDPIPGR